MHPERHPVNPIHVPPHRLHEALRTISVYEEPPSDRAARNFIDYAHAAGLMTDLCWAIEDSATGKFESAVIVLPNRGRTGMTFTSPPKNPAHSEQVASLLAFAVTQIPLSRIVLAQALCRPAQETTIRTIQNAGFSHLADLDYLEGPVANRRPPAPLAPDPEIDVVTYSESDDDEIKAILDRSYIGTLDCPGLCGLRPLDDILADHKGAHVIDPDLWLIARKAETGVGVLMLNPLSDGPTVELSYIGIAPEGRGRNLGQRLLVQGLARLKQRKYKTLVLAVDHANTPARRMYDAFGFKRTDQRTALIYPIESRATPQPMTFETERAAQHDLSTAPTQGR